MCGICGIVSLKASDGEARVRRMMARMRHRGPDGDGLWQSDCGRVTFGHVRLAIVDTSAAGAQPMHHPQGLHQVVNGEFYNYPDLKRSLETKAPYLSDCDSEILLHGYATRGDNFVRELNGMFAFGLFDQRAGRVLLGRDRMGIKPLYYLQSENELVFASEIKALFAALAVNSWTIDSKGLSEYLCYQTTMGGRTLFEGIRQVKPGHILSCPADAPEKASETAFWTAEARPEPKMDFETAVRRFTAVFGAGVHRHLLSDVPVASYLSAGFDSASVFTEACTQKREDSQVGLTAYTGRFDLGNNWYDETAPAAQVAAHQQSPHECVDITSHDLTTHLDDVIDALDEPRMGMGAFSQYMVARAVSGSFKVILTGHGGDELFSGYPVFKYARHGLTGIRRLSEAPHFVYFALSGLRGKREAEFGRGLPVLWSAKDQARMLRGSRFAARPHEFMDAELSHIDDPSTRILMTYLKAYLPGLLVVEDKISMAHSIESRTPVLDNELLDLSLSIPNDVKLNDGTLKAIIKAHAANRLPASYFDQPKRGFPTPLRHWLRGPLSGTLLQRLRASEHLREIFDPTALSDFLDAYQGSWRRHLRPLDEIQSHRVWQLLSLEAWLRIWSDKYGVALRMP